MDREGMKHINIYNTTEEYNAAKSELYTLEHFVAYNKETNEILTKNIVNITFNITPEDATVNYSIDNESYDQTTTGNGIVSDVLRGSTIYYKISKSGYETITKSQVVNNNITITENMVENDYILVSTNSSGFAEILKHTNQAGTETESITIPASSTDYKVDDLIYGFRPNPSNSVRITKLDVTHLNTSNIISMYRMFHNCKLTSLNVSNFDTSNVTSMSDMFNTCSSLTQLDLSNFDTSNVTDMGGMFKGCVSLTSLDLSNFNTSNVTSMGGMVASCVRLTSLNVSNFDTSNVTEMTEIFFLCNSLNHIKCKQAFKDWCLANQDTILLPDAMKNGGGGTWEIVD